MEGLVNNTTLVVNLEAPSIQEEGEEQNPQVWHNRLCPNLTHLGIEVLTFVPLQKLKLGKL